MSEEMDKVAEVAEEVVEAVEDGAAKVADAVDSAATAVKQAAAEPAKKRKKWPVVLGVIVAVIVVAGVGFWTWHEQPSFCSAFCHTSMDSYVATYDQAAGSAGTDKWGNEVSNSSAMLVVAHKEANENCLSCHVPSLSQQIGEVMETITGNYTVVARVDGNGYGLFEEDLESLMVNSGHAAGTADQFCLRSGCHDVTTREELKAATADMARNPHAWQHQENACSDCHKSHRASVMYCTQCHADAAAEMPDGWITFQEDQALQKTVFG